MGWRRRRRRTNHGFELHIGIGTRRRRRWRRRRRRWSADCVQSGDERLAKILARTQSLIEYIERVVRSDLNRFDGPSQENDVETMGFEESGETDDRFAGMNDDALGVISEQLSQRRETQLTRFSLENRIQCLRYFSKLLRFQFEVVARS